MFRAKKYKYPIFILPIILYFISTNREFSESHKFKNRINIPGVLSESEMQVNICTQNIFRLGDKGSESEEFDFQLKYLVDRISEVGCAVVALQEVPGNMDQSTQIVDMLSAKLEEKLNSSHFDKLLGPSNDPYIRNAFIFDANRVKLMRSKSLYHDSLPRFSSRSGPTSYARGPLMAEFEVLNKNMTKRLVLINYHLKSKSRGFKDKTGLDFEVSRLLSAAGIRERMDEFMRGHKAEYVEVLLGDRNADYDSASAKVFSGELDMNDFRGNNSCEIVQSGQAVCDAEHYVNPVFMGTLESKNREENENFVTHSYRGRGSILDEIYISKEDFDRTLDLNGRIRAGVVGEFSKGSDHLLTWVGVDLK